MRAYERLRRRLADEVGTVPSRSLQRLNDEILRQAPGTEWGYSGPDTRASPPTADRLPRPLTSFVGRVGVVAKVVEAARRRGLVTVRGPGGVGKTRVAIEAARALDAADRPRDGVWWCDLSAVVPDHEPDGVAVAVAAALGVAAEPGTAMSERILRFLGGKDLVLVIDNCEHVADPVAELAAGLLRRARGVGLLATSRESLAIEGETTIELEPLGEDDAVHLFVERARWCGTGSTSTPGTPPPWRRSAGASTGCPSPSSSPPAAWSHSASPTWLATSTNRSGS